MQVTTPAPRGRGKSRQSLALIDAAIAILREIHPAGVRAVCYRLFIAGYITGMSKAETNKVSTHLTWAREQGHIPWHWIVDETREAERVAMWENPAEFIEKVKRSYRLNWWTDQPHRIEIVSEKGTIRGTLLPVLHKYGVTFRCMHGYGSSTAIKQAADDSLVDKPTTMIYVGDWDPSGLHMSAIDLPRRLQEYGGRVHLERLALTEQDTHTGSLPSFPADTKGPSKEGKGDPRYRWYVDHYGTRCWELDALSPVILRDRVEQAIVARLDLDAWRRAERVEAAEQESLTSILNAWPGISGRASKCQAPPREAS